MEDPATRPRRSARQDRAARHRFTFEAPEDERPPAPRRNWTSTIAIPTACLLAIAVAAGGSAMAANRGTGSGNSSSAALAAASTQQSAMVNQALDGGPGTMPDPRLKSAAAKAARKAASKAKMNAAAAAAAPPAAAAAVPNPNCSLIVPANPLTATGLATPYQLVATDPAAGPCNEANINQTAFVQGAIVSPAGQLTLYDPLVIDQGTQPAAAPAAAQVPAGSTVAVWFGFNGDNLTLQSAAGTTSLQQGNCVNGAQGSIFGQFGYCNAVTFFQTANGLIGQNLLQVQPLGTANDGLPCPTVRSFALVDQDQGDNVTSHYLATANGQIAQNNAAARATLQQAGQNNLTDLFNGSDNRLLDVFVNPALGCTAWSRPNGSTDGTPGFSLPLNELQAAAFQAAPVAIAPLNDPMTLVNNANSTAKTNLFRVGDNQLPIGAAAADNGDGATYCNNLFNNAAGIQRIFNDKATFVQNPSADPAAANNLFTFLAMRASGSFDNLGCAGLINQANPITLTTDGNGVVIDATFTAGGATASPTATATPTATPTAVPTATATAVPTGTATAMPTATAVPTGTATAAAGAVGAAASASASAP